VPVSLAFDFSARIRAAFCRILGVVLEIAVSTLTRLDTYPQQQPFFFVILS
jgi:hypothetical protein